MNPRMAVIDIGTNSTLLLIAEVTQSGQLLEIAQYSNTTRLGRKIHETGVIGKQGLIDTLKTLCHYQSLIQSMHVKQTIAAGTEVFRLAKNQDDILAEIQNKTGLSVNVLSESQEAEYSYTGAVSGKETNKALVIDIGGGSTEMIAGEKYCIQDSISLPIGAVIMTDQFLLADPPDKKACDRLKTYVSRQIPQNWKNTMLQIPQFIIVGGTATTLAALHLQLDHYDPFQVDGLKMTYSDIARQIKQLCNCSLKIRQQWLSVDPKRADIIIAGTLILQSILHFSAKKQIMIRDRGMRHGIALKAGIH